MVSGRYTHEILTGGVSGGGGQKRSLRKCCSFQKSFIQGSAAAAWRRPKSQQRSASTSSFVSSDTGRLMPTGRSTRGFVTRRTQLTTNSHVAVAHTNFPPMLPPGADARKHTSFPRIIPTGRRSTHVAASLFPACARQTDCVPESLRSAAPLTTSHRPAVRAGFVGVVLRQQSQALPPPAPPRLYSSSTCGCDPTSGGRVAAEHCTGRVSSLAGFRPSVSMR